MSMQNLDQSADGEVLDTHVDDMPVRCHHVSVMSGMQARCERIDGHRGPHRVTATWMGGEFL
ncbi:hypothetical protein ACK8HH_17335 [Gordonia sp. LUNF6]|uniref:hypothetical protein n=1 Tax=Gordonia sp. LUNF6 TaxID=3388658 RepID=UPI00399B081D